VDYTTHYEITNLQPQAFAQVWQDAFHYHSDLFDVGSQCFNAVLLLGILAYLLSALIMIIWFGSAKLLRGKPIPGNSVQLKMLVCLFPISFCMLVVGWITLDVYPKHVQLVQRYAAGDCKKVEGVIQNLEIKTWCGQRGAGHGTAAIFSLDKRDSRVPAYLQTNNYSFRSNSVGFDNPTDSVIRNGNKVRMWIIENGINPPIILRLDVLRN
jgi:hypothetical protein